MVSILCCKGIVIIIPGFVGTLLLLVVLGLEVKSCNVAWFATIVACLGVFAGRCGPSSVEDYDVDET